MYAAMLSMFAFDSSGWGLLIHLIPAFVVVIVGILSYYKPRLGGILFLTLSIGFFMFFKHYGDLVSALIIEGPLVLLAIRFLRDK